MRSVLWLLTHWLLTQSGHQKLQYWLCKIWKYLTSIRTELQLLVLSLRAGMIKYTYIIKFLEIDKAHRVLTWLNMQHSSLPIQCKLMRIYFKPHINGLIQDCSNSNALAKELLQSCPKPSIYEKPKIWKKCKTSSPKTAIICYFSSINYIMLACYRKLIDCYTESIRFLSTITHWHERWTWGNPCYTYSYKLQDTIWSLKRVKKNYRDIAWYLYSNMHLCALWK